MWKMNSSKPPIWFRLSGLLLGPFLTTLFTNCSNIISAGLHIVYEPVELDTQFVHRDIPYWPGSDYDPRKHRLDLFLPDAEPGWPVMVFVHGGGWDAGDKDLKIGEDDVYGNIGRHFARRGIGVAVINYRLLPEVEWPDQVRDVARAVAWTYRNIAKYGGDPDQLYLSGHSAGAQLATWVALDESYLRESDLPASIINGVVAVSGVGYDMVDQESFDLGIDINYLISRFKRGEDDDNWQREASPIFHATSAAPPFLIYYGEHEWIWLHHQNKILAEALVQAGTRAEIRVIEGEGHRRTVLSLSHPEKPLGEQIAEFVKGSAS